MIQSLPIRISTLNQFEFPLSLLFLQLFLPRNNGFHALMKFIPNQPMNTIALRKSFHQIVLVRPYPLHRVRSHTYLESAFLCSRECILSAAYSPATPWIPAFAGMSAPESVRGRRGESPLQVNALRPVTERNCVTVKWGGEQREVKSQSVG